MAFTIIAALSVGLILTVLWFPMIQLAARGWNSEAARRISMDYFKNLLKSPVETVNNVFKWWYRQIWNNKARETRWFDYIPFLPFVTTGLLIFLGWAKNPYQYIQSIHGSGREAKKGDVKRMGLFTGFMMVVGKFKGRYLKLPETLSVLCLAPPGTGKTVAVVNPTIFETENACMIINDPKPELCFQTSGYRATKGPVFVINWAEADVPDKGIYYPSWNPLSPKCLPGPGAARDMYIDSICNVLVQISDKDPHWGTVGRAALAGYINFICSKCEQAIANDYFCDKMSKGPLSPQDSKVLATYYSAMHSDQDAIKALALLRQGQLDSKNYVPIGTWEGLPADWVGREPCFSMLLDWQAEVQVQVMEASRKKAEAGDANAMFEDQGRVIIEKAMGEAKKYHYAHRVILEMSQLANTPDKERGSIMSTAMAGINIFRNAAVKERTSSCDIAYEDLRGIRNPRNGRWEPMTVYLSVNQVDAAALNPLTALFVELFSRYAVAYKPNDTMENGKTMGPYPILFVLDEFPQMPKMTAVLNGPAVGRGQKVSYLLIGQDMGQIEGKYSAADVETIISTTAVKVVLAQNNEKTAERFDKMIGQKTVEVESKSHSRGINVSSNERFRENVNVNVQGTSVIGVARMMSLPKEKQLVIMQGFTTRPIIADSPRWFLDPNMKRKAAIKPSPFVPKWIVDKRAKSAGEELRAQLAQELNG